MLNIHKLLCFICVAAMLSCSGRNKPLIPESPKELIKVPSVSVYDHSVYGLPLLEDINNSKSQITNIKLGERFFSYDSVKTDTIKGNDYCKVELSDGTSGWARRKYIIKNAFPGAVLEATPVFERPDILTKSMKKEFTIIDFLVVSEEKENWYKIHGRNHINSGWIEKEKVLLDDNTIACVVLARRKLLNKDGEWLFDMFDDFFKTSPFKSQDVFQKLKEYKLAYENLEDHHDDD